MSQQLISRNPCLQKLQQEGFSLQVCGGFLVIHHIPYLNSELEIKEGKLIMKLNLSGDLVVKPEDHTAYWSGEIPHEINGSAISALINNSNHMDHGNNLFSDHFLSCKPDTESYPDENYPTYYEKVKTYCQRISAPALSTDNIACKRIMNQIAPNSPESIFEYVDTNSSKADISPISETFASQKVAIVGLGGTGAYLLDFLAKMPVKEIHLYDDDTFNSHNAFRCPGAASVDILNECQSKVDYLKSIYSNMHRGIIAHSEKVTESNISELYQMDVVFICVDRVSTRNLVSKHLIEQNILFIDSGLGILKQSNSLFGQLRVTTGFAQHYNHISSIFGSDVELEDEYSSNIQIAELNAMAAVLMIVKWKRMMNFYSNTTQDNNIVYTISTNEIVTE
jgi:hypothetical protein